ncbi:hypothetical protein TcWFU_010291 [Taenia crassiceps]|uniref:Uncharacterized protein n=1 Tax=Taenia crassiceps TaxID=6207 RepID=A0ABR4Q2Y8_9CEST
MSITALFDVLFSRPHPVPLWKSFLMVLAYYLGYALYVEYLIHGYQLYAYPLLKMFTVTGRYQFYGAVFCITFLVFLVSCLFIRVVSGYRQSKPKRDKAKNKKSQHQLQQQQPQKSSPTPPISAKKKKQAKQE